MKRRISINLANFISHILRNLDSYLNLQQAPLLSVRSPPKLRQDHPLPTSKKIRLAENTDDG